MRGASLQLFGFCLLGRHQRVIAILAAHEQARQSSWRRDFDFDAVPLPVIHKVRRLVANRILMAQFERYLFENVIHLGGRARKESLSPGNVGQFVKDALTFHPQTAAGVAQSLRP